MMEPYLDRLESYFSLLRPGLPANCVGVTPLPGEADQNFRLRLSDGQRLLLKISPSDTPAAAISFQQAILTHLRSKSLPFATPHYLGAGETKQGAPLSLLSYIEGRLLDEVNPRTPALFRSWGQTCGHLSRALADFDHPYAHRDYRWDPLRSQHSRELQRYLTPAQTELTDYFYGRLARLDFSQLRRSVNYNDAHEHNLLVDGGDHITGVVDFGDALYTATICELAIACAYAGMRLPDPLAAMREVITGYHSVFPLHEAEIAVLFDLIAARLLLTVTAAAEGSHLHPTNEYLTISAAPAWSLLQQLRPVHPSLARAHFRVAAGFTAHPNWQIFHDWATGAQDELTPLTPLEDVRTINMDLSVGSKVLGNNRNFTHLPTFVTRLRRYLEDQDAQIGTGGYAEVRPFYTTDDFRSEGNQGPRWRSVHLGLDFWTREPGLPIVAPLDGTVHSCGYEAPPCSYGNTIILRHEPRPGLVFYTLYGHLSDCSLEHIRAGSQVKRGELLATVGGKDVNGGWPPHLHFQVMLEVFDNSADFPGVAYPEEREVWLGLCPDPRTLVPHPLPQEKEPSQPAEQLVTARRKLLGGSLSISYRRPLQMLRGSMQYLYDTNGRRYLDTVNNVAHVGHEHHRVVRAAQQQLGVLNTNTRYLHPTIVEFARALTATLPDELSVVHFVNSGSEANELALRMAATVSGTRHTLAMEMGYHGNTTRTIEVSSYKFARRGGEGRPAETSLLPLPDQLRGRNLDPTPHLPEHKCSFISESILSCGGQLPLPEGYLDTVYRHVRERGGICIADEVQTGIGRIGSHFYAFELQGVVPDIVTIGKPIGNGHPLGAVVCTRDVADAFNTGMEYFNTFGGNPVSSATGLEVLRVVAEERLQQRAADMGGYLTGLLLNLQSRHPIIADVRGHGLFLGFELCGNDFAPATAQADYLKERMRELGFLMSTDGPHENVMKIKPPLCFTRDNAELLVEYIDRVLAEDGMQLRS
jgi:4-aminobutyrate aminotransferase-like enzyme/Ser/Thr protein kinase RdoA (MazF antagonist)